MTFGTTDSDPSGALREFCAMLRELWTAAGGPTVESLNADPQFPARKSSIYATLNGQVATPPNWRFVEALVRRCARYAAARRVDLTITTEIKDWEYEHRKLTELWERHRRQRPSSDPDAHGRAKGPGRVLTVQNITYYPVRSDQDPLPRRLGVITGDIRQVRCANIWVNSENTEMQMARVHEFSISAIIRYEGARHDDRGRIAEDLIACDLAAKVADRRPVEPGSVVVTGPGELRRRNGVQHVIHAAVVHGEPGSGFRPIAEIGRCVSTSLLAAERLRLPDGEPVTILFPLLGTGSAGGDLPQAATALIHAAHNYLRTVERTRVGTVLFLAYTDLELKACANAFKAAGLRPKTE
jgi:O-acetyl-ADP-ribose deacetylase (regulator of RNase III)